MSEKENVFDVAEFLTTTTFKIPVSLVEPKVNPNTTPKTRKIMVTYQFTDEIADKITAGVDEEIDNPDYDPENPHDKPEKIEQHRGLTLNEQLVMVVKEIDGIAELSEDLFKQMRYWYRQGILDAIYDDIYPKRRTSTV